MSGSEIKRAVTGAVERVSANVRPLHRSRLAPRESHGCGHGLCVTCIVMTVAVSPPARNDALDCPTHLLPDR